MAVVQLNDPEQRVARATPSPFVRESATRADLVVLGLVAFILEFDLPYSWFRTPNAIASNRDSLGSGQTAALLVVAVVYGIFTTGLDFGAILRNFRREWLFPGFIGLNLASSLWSIHPFATFSDAMALLCCVLVAYWAFDRMALRTILGVFGWVFAIGAFASAFMIKFLPQYAASFNGWTGLLKNRNTFGQSMALGVLVLLLCARLHRRYRVFFYGSALMCALLVIGSQSKTSLVAMIAMPVMLLVFTVFRARRTLYAAVAIVMSVVALVGIFVALDFLPTITESLGRETNLSGRTGIWGDVVDIIQRRPWFGYGLHGMWSDPYGAARVISIRYGPLPHAHNALLETAINTGYIGALLILGVFVRLIVRGARVVRYFEGTAGLFPLAYAGYVLSVSITEVGALERSLKFLLLAIAVTAAARGRRDAIAGVRRESRLGRTPVAVRC